MATDFLTGSRSEIFDADSMPFRWLQARIYLIVRLGRGGSPCQKSCLPHTRGSTGNVAPGPDCCRSRPHAIRPVSVWVGGLLQLISAVISCRCSLFGSLAYVSDCCRSRPCAIRLALPVTKPGKLGCPRGVTLFGPRSNPQSVHFSRAQTYYSMAQSLPPSRLPLFGYLCSSRQQPPRGLM
jgi:hypothetical protein